MAFVALLDANVLVNAPIRDCLLRAGENRLYRVAFSGEILSEMRRALEHNLGRTQQQTEYLVSEILRSFEDALVRGYEDLIPAMTNHEGDRHVLAAAVRAGAETVVTFNTSHFPEKACHPYGIEAQKPDEFLMNLWGVDQIVMARILHEQAADIGQSIWRLTERLRVDAPNFVRAAYDSGLLEAASVEP